MNKDLKLDIQTFRNIENVIFDLGGVLVQIDFLLPVRHLKKYGIENFVLNQLQQWELISQFEMGLITEEKFIHDLWDKLNQPAIEFEKLKEIWNSIIVDIPLEIFTCLEKMKKEYHLFVLSNTNPIHIQYLYTFLKEKRGIKNFEFYFQKVYYSFLLGCKKPDDSIFKYVIKDAKIDPSKTLFIDDTYVNVKKGEELGFQTFLMPTGKLLHEVIQCI